MRYIEWFIKAILRLLSLVIGCLTNPIVCFFADEKGELPSYLGWYGTGGYDNKSCDISWLIDEGVVPKIFRYDYHKHYKYTYEQKGDGYVHAGYVDLLDGNFTLKERIQRYFCRVWWLNRNCMYGFAYSILGRDYKFTSADVITQYDYGKGNKCYYAKADDVWGYYLERQYYKDFYLRVYIGWKIKNCADYQHVNRAMIAIFVSPFRKVGD